MARARQGRRVSPLLLCPFFRFVVEPAKIATTVGMSPLWFPRTQSAVNGPAIPSVLRVGRTVTSDTARVVFPAISFFHFAPPEMLNKKTRLLFHESLIQAVAVGAKGWGPPNAFTARRKLSRATKDIFLRSHHTSLYNILSTISLPVPCSRVSVSETPAARG
jgi:hypothetical protein